MTVSLKDARRIIAAGEKYAVHLGQPVNIAVVDHAGILVAHVRMDNARIETVDISVDKACAARACAPPAHLVSSAAGEGQSAWESPPVELTSGGLPGALPLWRDGVMVGAVGVSGGSAPMDQAIARAAATAF